MGIDAKDANVKHIVDTNAVEENAIYVLIGEYFGIRLESGGHFYLNY